MAMPRLDSLFHRPRSMRVVLQKFFIVIGLDHERLHLAQSFDDHLGHVAEIGNEAEAACAGLKDEPSGSTASCGTGNVCTVMSQIENYAPVAKFASFDAALNELSLRKLLPLTRCNKIGTSNLRQKNFKSTDVVAVFMREQDAIDAAPA
jgi:hypothetical protein